MNILKKVENLLEQVDQKTQETVQDVRSGRREARQVADSLNHSKAEVFDVDRATSDQLKSRLKQMQQDFDAASEVLTKSQQRAADKESKLNQQLLAEKADREKREMELVTRIKMLEMDEKHVLELEEMLGQTREELETVRNSNQMDVDHLELQRQCELAQKDAESARQGLQNAMRDSAHRITELERSNAVLLQELGMRKPVTDDGEGSQVSLAKEPIVDLQLERIQELERVLMETQKQALVYEEKHATVQNQLREEQSRFNHEKASLTKANQELAAKLKEVQNDNAKLNKEVVASANSLPSQQANKLNENEKSVEIQALEKRLETLSSYLEHKQRHIDLLRTDKSALEERLQMYQHQQQLPPHALHRDVFDGNPAAESDSNQKRFRMPKWKLESPLLQKIVDVIDEALVTVAVFLRQKPVLRSALIVYLLLVHIWLSAWYLFTSGASENIENLTLRGGSVDVQG